MKDLIRGLTISCLFALTYSAFGQDFIPYKLKVEGTDREIIMIPVKGGSFYMGSTDEARSDERPQHEVSVSDFWMSEMEVTWEQYEAFVYLDHDKLNLASEDKLEQLGIDGITSATTPYAEMSFGMGKDGFPAVNMTQYAALMFTRWLSAVTGEFYRLPTEAEWEYACKAGMDRIYSHGKDLEVLREYAVFDVSKYEKVGSKKAPSTGLFDLNGNVAEWTMDQFDSDFYSKSPKVDPWRKPDKLYPRVARGGSWKGKADDVTCTSRLQSSSKWKRRDPQLPKSRWWHTNAPFVGIRVVRPRIQPTKTEIEKFWLEAMEDYGN